MNAASEHYHEHTLYDETILYLNYPDTMFLQVKIKGELNYEANNIVC